MYNLLLFINFYFEIVVISHLFVRRNSTKISLMHLWNINNTTEPGVTLKGQVYACKMGYIEKTFNYIRKGKCYKFVSILMYL